MIFRQCDTNALMLLEQTCQEWAPPRPRLSLVQEAVRDKMSRIRLPGTSLGCTMGLRSHPLLLQDKERLKKRVEDWCQDPQRASLHMLQDLNPENIITLASEDPVCRKQMMLDSVRKAVSLMFEAASPYSLAASPSNNEIAAAARALVVRLCAAEATRNCVVQVGAVPSLVQMLQVGSEDAKKSAARIIGRIAHSEQHRNTLVKAGALTVLMDMMANGPQTIKKNAIGSLSRIAHNEEHRDALVRAGGIPTLTDTLRTGKPSVKQNAAEALGVIAQSEQHRDDVLSAGVVSQLTHIIQYGPRAAKRNSLWALSQISKTSRHARSIVSSPAIQAVVGTLHSGEPELQRIAANAIGRVAETAEFADTLVSMGTVGALIPLCLGTHLHASFPPTQNKLSKYAAHALAQIAKHPKHQTSVLQASTDAGVGLPVIK